MRVFIIAAMFFILLASNTLAAGKPPKKAKATPTPEATVTVTDAWNKSLVASLNLNQASFGNWKQGGTNFISWQAGLLGKLEKDTETINWLNSLKMAYGLTYVDKQGTRKSSDTFDFSSVLAWKAWPQVNPYVSLATLTQFDNGYDYNVDPAVQTSAFLDPGYFTESAGLKYTPDKCFNTRLGFAVKETVASQFAPLYTDDPATLDLEKMKIETGLNSVSELNLKLSENSSFGSKLDLFWNGKGLDRTVADWQNILSVSLNKIISINLEYDFRYDPVVYLGWQTKETLGIGFAYSLL